MNGQIKCGHCSTRTRPVYHKTTREVAFCGFQAARGNLHAANLKAEVRAEVAPKPRPNEWQSKIPRAMVESLRDGRYAACPSGSNEEFDNWTFLRVWRPTSGKRRGQLVIRTQHSDAYRDFITIYPSGSVWFAKTGDRLDQSLLMIAADPYTSAMNYAFLHSVCSSCGKKLTDNRSRYYGIGPECEKKWPEIINRVNADKGPFHGA